MKIIKKVISTFLVLVCLSACESTFDILADFNETDSNWYDENKCEHGYPSEPGVARRPGCVNSQTWVENAEELKRYNIEREIYHEQSNK